MGKLVYKNKTTENEKFYDNIPLDVEKMIERLIEITNKAETKYIKNYSKLDDSIGSEIIGEIEEIISNLNRHYIDEMIKKDLIKNNIYYSSYR